MQVVGRGVGQGDAGQRIELGHVRTAGGRGHIEVAQVERLGHRAAGRDIGVAGADVGVERIGLGPVDIHQRPAGHHHAEGLGVDRALAGQLEAAALDAQLLVGVDRGVEGQLAAHVGEVEAPVLDDEVADRRQAHRRLDAAVGKVPVLPPLGVGAEHQVGPVEDDLAQVGVTPEQRHEPDPDADALERPHLVAAGPGGVGDGQAVDRGGGLPGPEVDVQVPGDAHLAVHPRRGDPLDRALEPVPVPHRDQHGDRDRDQRQDAAGPGESPVARPLEVRARQLRAPQALARRRPRGLQPASTGRRRSGRATPGLGLLDRFVSHGDLRSVQNAQVGSGMPLGSNALRRAR